MGDFEIFNREKLNIFSIAKISFVYARRESFLLAIISFFNGISPVLLLMAISSFIDSVTRIYRDNSNYKSMYLSLVFIVVCLIYSTLSQILTDVVSTKFKNSIREKFGIELIEMIGSLRYKYFEDDKSLDLISRVGKNPEEYLSKAYIDLLKWISLAIKILGIMIILFVRVPIATVIIGLVSIPTFIVANKAGNINYKANVDQESSIRRVKYFSEVLKGRSFAKERTLFKYITYINNIRHKEYDKARKIRSKARLKWLIGSEISASLTSFLIGLVILVLLKPLKEGSISLGIFVSVVNSVISLIPDLSWQLPEYTESLSHSVNYVNDLSNLFSLDNDISYIALPNPQTIIVNSIEFKNVSFRYPNTNEYVIRNLNLYMKGSKHYSFVGKNGSGKSTIIKLLTGMYDEYEGDILINGLSLRDYSNEEIKSMFSVVFQDFSKYQITLRENVEVGDINSVDENSRTKKLIDIINKLQLSDLVRNLNKGIETSLSKIDEDGVDISGGQWQKIAIARALMNERSVRILDEPTSALDPFVEKSLYEIFEKENKGKLTIFISHRLASTKFADKIFVLDKGELSQQGDFNSLLAEEGLYKTMFDKQRKWYQDEK